LLGGGRDFRSPDTLFRSMVAVCLVSIIKIMMHAFPGAVIQHGLTGSWTYGQIEADFPSRLYIV
jgi:hypothetical protein